MRTAPIRSRQQTCCPVRPPSHRRTWRPPDGQGSGLLAEYWANSQFEGEPLLTRTDPQVAINLGFFNIPHFNAISPRLPPTPMELNGRISVRWRGTLAADTTGTHRLSLTSLGSASLSLDGATILRVRGDGLHGPPVDHDAFPPLPPLVPDEGPRIETVELELARRGSSQDRGGVRRRLGRAERPDRRPGPARLGAPARKHPAARPRGRTPGCRVRRGGGGDADVRERDDGSARP